MARIYVGTYESYNNGSLFGKWFDLEDYVDAEDFYKACKEYHKREEDPEYMFQDYEGIPEELIGESWLDDDLWEYLELDDDEKEQLEAFMSLGSYNKFSEYLEQYREKYLGELGGYGSEDAKLGHWVAENGYLEIPDDLSGYIDYEIVGRDFGSSDFNVSGGYVFENR